MSDADLVQELARVLAGEMEGLSPEGWEKQSAEFQAEFRDGAESILLFLQKAGWLPPSPPPPMPAAGELPIAVQVWRSPASQE